MKQYRQAPSMPRGEAPGSILEHDIMLVGSKGRVRCRAIFGSGASYSIVLRDIAERVEPLVSLPN